MSPKFFINLASVEEIKKRYKELCLRYHPDLAGGDLETMKSINIEYAYVVENPGFTYKYESDKSDLNIYPDVLNKIIGLRGITIELIGRWLWLSGATYLYSKILKETGFWFAPKKKMWYFRPVEMKGRGHKPLPIDSIRRRYGSDVIDNDIDNVTNNLTA